MKIMWIMNAPIGQSASLLGYRSSQSGTWIDATYKAILNESNDIDVVFVTPGSTNRRACSKVNKFVVHEISGVKSCRGKRDRKGAIDCWRRVISEVMPDVIHIWGSEFTFPLDVMDASGKIPCIITIQGVMQAISKYASPETLPYRKTHFNLNPIDWLKSIRINQSLRAIRRQVAYENEIVERCSGIICDNEWSAAHYRARNPDVTIYFQPLAISNSFREKTWNLAQMERRSIFTIAGRTPLKGLHQILHAMPIVKRRFPDAKLYIPGNFESRKPPILFSLPYANYLKRLIVEYNISNNITFCGQLNSEEMAGRMCRSNVFVMPSRIENHSSTLREAMHVGCPCVTSMVGGSYEFAEHNRNALMYRYEEYEVLADHIINVFSNDDLACELGAAAQQTISEKYPQQLVGKLGVDIYRAVLRKQLELKIIS